MVLLQNYMHDLNLLISKFIVCLGNVTLDRLVL